MLKLTRHIGETLNIGDDVEVTVLSIKGKLVQIGVSAPRAIPVYRGEIYKRIKQEDEGRIGLRMVAKVGPALATSLSSALLK